MHERNSGLLKHSREEGHNHTWAKYFQELGINYWPTVKQKISEALIIKKLK